MKKCRRKASEIGTRLQFRCEWGLRPPLRHGPRQLVLFAESMATIHPYCVGKTAVAEDLRFNSIQAEINETTTYILTHDCVFSFQLPTAMKARGEELGRQTKRSKLVNAFCVCSERKGRT